MPWMLAFYQKLKHDLLHHIFLPLKNNIRIFVPLCNILYLLNRQPLNMNIYMLWLVPQYQAFSAYPT